jgi:hypothetical protein
MIAVGQVLPVTTKLDSPDFYRYKLLPCQGLAGLAGEWPIGSDDFKF